jgi:hypothetical protein
METLMSNVNLAIKQVDSGAIQSITFSEAHVNMNCIVEMKSGRGYVIRRHLGWLGKHPKDSEIEKIFLREKTVNKIIRQQLSLPAPEIFLIDKSKSIINDIYLISERKTGTLGERLLGWLSYHEQETLMNIAGRTLRMIHSINSKTLTKTEQKYLSIKSEQSDLEIFTKNLFEDIKILSNRGMLTPSVSSRLITIYRIYEDLLKDEFNNHCLLHSDFNLRNILFDINASTGEIELSGILDTEGSCIGSPIHDFMSLELWSFLRRKWLTSIVPASLMRSWFFNGYGTQVNSVVYKLIFLRNRLKTELLDIGYLDDNFVLQLNNKDLQEDLSWIELP